MYAAYRFKLISGMIFLCIVALLASCAGKGAAPVAGVPDSAAAQALPGLSELPDAPRSSLMCGPGWTPIDPLDKSHKILTNGCTSTPAGELVISGAGSTGFAIFAIQGFDGDAFPTSLQINLSGPPIGGYYAAFADYIADCWQPVGPFTGSGEVEIPRLDLYTSPTAYTDAQGVFWLALLVEDGSSITVANFSVGVHGGDAGPQPPVQLDGSGGDNGVLLTWTHSVDYKAPDFAGYFVERAPLFSGSFTRLGSGPERDPYFQDHGAAVGESYRYHVAAVDACGNISSWVQTEVTPLPGGEMPPVPVVDLPDGPLYAPASVTFDLSGSYDPLGEPLTGFDIEISPLMPVLSGPGPSFSATLQPGCYVLRFIAHTATRAGTTQRLLKVYPRWRSSSALICEPDPDGFRRLIRLSGIKDPASGAVALFGQDGTYPGYSRWLVPDDGNNPVQLACFQEILEYNGEPLRVGDTILVPLSFHELHGVALYGPDVTQWAEIDERSADEPIAMAASPSGLVWKIWSVHPAATTDLYISEFIPGGSGTTLVPNIVQLRALNAVYNPGKNAIEVIYADAGTIQWVRWDPLAKVVVDSAILSPTIGTWVDIELCPATGLPLAAYYDSVNKRYRTRQLDALDTWEPELTVDDTADNNTPADLAFAPDGGTAEIFFALGAGQAHLYELNAGVWGVRNTVSYSAHSGIGVALMPGASGREMLVGDALDDERCLLAQLNDDGTDSVLWEVPGGQGQGLQLSGANASDGVHVGWRDFVSGTGRHFVSNDGAIWTDLGSSVGPVSQLEMASTIDGELYLSHHDGASARLMWWDGSDWQLRVTVVGLAVHRPFFGSNVSNKIDWFAYENGGATLHHYNGNETSGYIDSPVVITDVPVWDGIANMMGADSQIMAEAGGATIDDSAVGLFEVGTASLDPLYSSPLSGFMNFLDSPLTNGRKMATTTYIAGFDAFPTQVFWLPYGPLVNPLRYTRGFMLLPQMTDLPFDFQIFSVEPRRTVSGAMAQGACAVGLVASLDGQQRYLEWSNFGEWEQLPLPDIQFMSAPELLIGADGRWHLIYKDYSNDRIYCRSSQ